MWVRTSFHSFKEVNLFHGARDVTDIRFLLQNQSLEYGYIYNIIFYKTIERQSILYILTSTLDRKTIRFTVTVYINQIFEHSVIINT